jgi:DNA ligase-associated metallophosphoesterase
MNGPTIPFAGETLELLPSGALFWPVRRMLIVSDLHLGKSERIARRGGTLLPPYETTETLSRLGDDIQRTKATCILCLGDSFDDTAAAEALDDTHRATLATLQAGRRWLWVEGNHDPGPLDLGGTHLAQHREGPITFRHIAATHCEIGEISGHYHPKAKIARATRPCFLTDGHRLILPAYGTYTGGLAWTAPVLRALLADRATAYLTGHRIIAVPVPCAA